MKSKGKRFIKFFLPTFFFCALCTIGLNLLFYGLPLLGLPKEENVLSVDITDNATAEKRTLTQGDNFTLAVNLAGILKWKPGRAPDGKPAYTLTYHMADGSEKAIASNGSTVWWKGKAYAVKSDNGTLFMKIAQGVFFPVPEDASYPLPDGAGESDSATTATEPMK